MKGRAGDLVDELCDGIGKAVPVGVDRLPSLVWLKFCEWHTPCSMLTENPAIAAAAGPS